MLDQTSGSTIYGQYIELNDLENEKVINSMQKLEYIKNTITTKDKLIKQINQNTEMQIRIMKNILFITSVIILSGLIFKFLPKYKKLIIILWIILGVYFMYIYNIFYFQDFFNKDKLIDIANEAGDDVYNNLDKYFGKDDDTSSDYTNWVNNNCKCNNNDNQYGESEEEMNLPMTGLSPGLYYYDGTSPKQLINPLPTEENTDKIYYPDYDKSPQIKFNNNHKHYPEKRKVLVGSNTYTSNL